MGSRPGLRLLLVLTLVMAISGAAGAFAAGGRFHRAVATADPTCVAPEPTDDPVVDEGDDTSVDDEETDDQDVQGDEDAQDDQDPQGEDEDAECDEAEPTDDADAEDDGDDADTGGKDAEVDPERQAACAEAAGWQDGVPETDEDVKLRGIENAMAHVYANCLKNDAPGLINALQRLAANAARHAAHEAEKAARAAEREAEKAARAAERAERKAERDAAKDERKAEHAAGDHGNPGHGNPGHGNPHD